MKSYPEFSSELILEASLEAFKKYNPIPSLRPVEGNEEETKKREDILLKIIDTDPTAVRDADGNITGTGSYTEHAARLYKTNPGEFDFEKVKKAFAAVNDLNKRKVKFNGEKVNPNMLKGLNSIADVEAFVQKVNAEMSKSAVDTAKDKWESVAPIVYDKNGYTVRKIAMGGDVEAKDKAAKELGKQSLWCTAWKKSMYSNYNKDRDLYIIWKKGYQFPGIIKDGDYAGLPYQSNLFCQIAVYPKNGNDVSEIEKPDKSGFGGQRGEGQGLVQGVIASEPGLADFFKTVLKFKRPSAIPFKNRSFKFTVETDPETGEEILVFDSLDLSDMGLTSLMELPWNQPDFDYHQYLADEEEVAA